MGVTRGASCRTVWGACGNGLQRLIWGMGLALFLTGCGWGAGSNGADEAGPATTAVGQAAEAQNGDTGASGADSDAKGDMDSDGHGGDPDGGTDGAAQDDGRRGNGTDGNGTDSEDGDPNDGATSGSDAENRGPSNGGAAIQALSSLALEPVAEGLTAPVAVDAAGDTLIVADQAGFLWRIPGVSGEALSSSPGTQAEPERVLDLRDRMVGIRPSYDERGLLGVALHPEVESNGRMFVYYSAPGTDLPSGWDHTGVLSEFQLTDEGVDPDSERRLLEVDQPQSNHNGGAVDFGPEGALYLSLGDGGGANDEGLGHSPGGNGQDPQNLLGSILRLNVDEPGVAKPWPDNPFDGDDGAPAIFAFGFRNPFRMSFDPETGSLWTGDVGQNRWEEVNQVVAGGNYGWPIREGPDCFSQDQPNSPPEACPDEGPNDRPLRGPVLSYRNASLPEGRGLAVIDGGVYRGDGVPGLRGRYVFGDWSTSFNAPDGHLFIATRTEGGWSFEAAPLIDSSDGSLGRYLLGISRDGAGEMLVLTSANGGPAGSTGRVDRLVAAP